MMVTSPEVSVGQLPPDFLYSRQVEPVGKWFVQQWERLHSNRTLSHGVLSGEESESEEEEENDDSQFEDDLEYLRSLDPKETKEQDHYKVLGISKLRSAATDDQIKRAHRFKVLKHHPDKRKAAGEEIKDGDDYFPCITKAFEILGNPVTRKSFDSVDPTFDDDVPDVLKKDKQNDFFKVFTQKFEDNSRWSVKTPVPVLGDIDSSRQDVDEFYSFWYDFDSWREYSYLDEEDKEKAGDKWERREIDKINKAERKERKAAEVKRIRKLVDNAYNSDPRIVKFREAEKEEKAAKKKARAEMIQAKKDEAERLVREAEEAERKAKEEKEKEEKAKAERAKKEKEAQKKALRTARKNLRNVAKENNMFAEDEDEMVLHLTELEKMCEIYTVDQLAELTEKLSIAGEGRTSFLKEMNKLNNKMDDERKAEAEMTIRAEGVVKGKSGAEWSTDELQLLIKSVNLFPAGTANRWDVCAEFINQHNAEGSAVRLPKEVLAKAKEMQSGNFATSSLKDEVNKMAYENSQKSVKKEVLEKCAKESEAGSQRHESPAEQAGLNNTTWSPEEQKLLEQALKTFPASTPERWERISEAVPNRSKKDCMKRYKELAELIKAKKAAMAAAKKS